MYWFLNWTFEFYYQGRIKELLSVSQSEEETKLYLYSTLVPLVLTTFFQLQLSNYIFVHLLFIILVCIKKDPSKKVWYSQL